MLRNITGRKWWEVMGGHVAQVCEVTHAYNILLGTSEGKTALG
jgi:hypothetical protein